MAPDRALVKSRLSGVFLLLFLSSTVSGLGSVVQRSYKFITDTLSWEDAQSACKVAPYTDLAIFYTQSDVDLIDLKQYYTWIGLHRDPGSPDDWDWSDGSDYKFTKLGKNLTASEDCMTIDYLSKKGWGQDCENVRFFMCQKKTSSDPEYVFIPSSKTWSEAQQYCRMNYHDLASFTSSDLDNLMEEQEFPVWIGLHREGETWNWTAGYSNFSNWKWDEPNNDHDCVSISSTTKEMTVQNCSDLFPYICISENVVLIEESKTWEEALGHCWALNLDLLSLQPSDEQDYLRSKMHRASTEEVWTGLRFLAGRWLWVNGATMLYTELPFCPVLGHHCGAISKEYSGSVEARDCMERKNFLCYKP